MPCWKEAAGLSSGDIPATLAEAMIKKTPRGGLPPEYATVRRVWGRTPPLFGENPAACHYRAAEWGHKEIELAAHELLQYLDRRTA